MMMSAVANLTPEEYRTIARALRRPVGRYSVERASQLSGVPRSTLYDWAKKNSLTPDFYDWNPKQWSYRDLVLARFFAWIRSKGMPASVTAREIADIRRRLADRTLDPSVPIRANKLGVFPDGEYIDEVTGVSAMPSILEMLQTFNLLEPVDDVSAMWGPSLVHPSEWTMISPDVFAGEPTIRRTRIPTAALFALEQDRGLDSDDIARIYPGLTAEQVDDGLKLEHRIRGLSVAA